MLLPPPPPAPPLMVGTEDDQDEQQVEEVGDELSPMMGAQNPKRLSRTSSGGEKRTPRTSNTGGGGGGKKKMKKDYSSQLLLGRSLHSALSHRPYDNLDRLQTPSSSSTPSTTDRNTMFRKRPQRSNLFTGRSSSSSSSSSNNNNCSMSTSHHVLSSSHSIRRRHFRSLSIGSGDDTDDDDDDDGDDDDDDDLNDDFDGFGGHGSKGDLDRSRSSHSHKHQRRRSYSDDADEDCDSLASPKARASSSFLKSFCSLGRHSRQRARKDDNGDIHYDDSTHSFPGLTCHASGTAQELFQTLAKRQKRQIQIMVVALLVCGVYLYHELHVHLERQEILLAHYSSKHDLIHRLQKIQQVKSGKDMTDKQALVDKEPEDMTIPNNDHDDQIHHLSDKISSLQTTLQIMARQQLMDTFALDDEMDSDQPMNVELMLHGLEQRPLVMQVQWMEMPHTTWTFLRQMTSTSTRWRLQAKHPWMEILPVNDLKDAAPAPTNQQVFGLEFLEESTLDQDRTFIVGMRNPSKGENDVMIYPRISIYNERGMCGHIDNEVCFGKIVDGIELLNLVRTMDNDVAIDKVSVAMPASL